MILDAFLWVMVAFHGIAFAGTVQILYDDPKQRSNPWQVGSLVVHALIVAWAGFILWLLA